MIYVTGDCHNSISIRKLSKFDKKFTEHDYLIIAGDFGFPWSNSPEDKYWLNWLNNKKYQILFVDGNHENFDILNSYEVESWHGGEVHKLKSNIRHLLRGQVFDIDGKKIFTFGGADSDDKEFRTPGKSWWHQEMPNQSEYEEGLINLSKHNYEVDVVITHTAPTTILPLLNAERAIPRYPNELTQYLDRIKNLVTYKACVPL